MTEKQKEAKFLFVVMANEDQKTEIDAEQSAASPNKYILKIKYLNL